MSTIRCVFCQGKGKVACKECEGTGKIPISTGTKIEKQADSPEANPEIPCPECDGTGRITCPGCLGGGYVDYPTFA